MHRQPLTSVITRILGERASSRDDGTLQPVALTFHLLARRCREAVPGGMDSLSMDDSVAACLEQLIGAGRIRTPAHCDGATLYRLVTVTDRRWFVLGARSAQRARLTGVSA